MRILVPVTAIIALAVFLLVNPGHSSDDPKSDQPSQAADSKKTDSTSPSKDDINNVIKSSVYEEIELTCPIDGSKVKGYEIKAFYTAGTDKDFCQLYAGQNLYDLWVVCSSNGFCGYNDDFGKPLSAEIKGMIKEQIKPYYDFSNISPWDKYAIAAKIKVWKKSPEKEIANTYLRGTYTLRSLRLGPNERVKEKILRANAIKYFQKAEKLGQVPYGEISNMKYLIGELYRRNEKYKKAVKYFENALKIKNRPEWVDKWAQEQMSKAYAEYAD